jgi:hypothetical protein
MIGVGCFFYACGDGHKRYGRQYFVPLFIGAQVFLPVPVYPGLMDNAKR